MTGGRTSVDVGNGVGRNMKRYRLVTLIKEGVFIRPSYPNELILRTKYRSIVRVLSKNRETFLESSLGLVGLKG